MRIRNFDFDSSTDNYVNICENEVETNGWNLEFVRPEKMTSNEYAGLCQRAVENQSLSLEFVNPNYLTKEVYDEICQTAVQKNGAALQFVNAKALNKNYLSICLAALKSYAFALEFVNFKELTQDEYAEICLTAVKKEALALQFVNFDSKYLTKKNYFHICQTAIEKDGLALSFVNKEDYADVCLLVVKKNGLYLKYVNPTNLSQEDFFTICLNALGQNGLALQFIPFQNYFENYFKLYRTAIENAPLALQYVYPKNLKTEADYFKICLNAVEKNGAAIEFVDYRYWTEEEYAQVCLAAVKSYNLNFKLINPEYLLKSYYSICLEAVKKDGLRLEFVDPKKLSRESYAEICLAAWDQNHSVSSFFTKEILETFIQNKELAIKLIASNYNVFDKLGNNEEVNLIKSNLTNRCETVIVRLTDYAEHEDSYRIYALKHDHTNPICVRTSDSLKDILNSLKKNVAELSALGKDIPPFNLAIIGEAALGGDHIGDMFHGFTPDDLVQIKKDYPFIKQITLIGCDTAGSEKILSVEHRKQEELKNKIRLDVMKQHPELHKTHIEVLVEDLQMGGNFSRCGFGVIDSSVDPKTFIKLPKTLNAAYILVMNKTKTSPSLYFIHRDRVGTKCITVNEYLSAEQMMQLKKLPLKLYTTEKDGYRFIDKKKGYISQKNYDLLTDEERAEIDKELLKKNGKLVANKIRIAGSLFDSAINHENILWAQNNKNEIVRLKSDVVDEIVNISEFKQINLSKYKNKRGQNKDDKPIYMQQLEINYDSEDFVQIKNSLAGRTIIAMQNAGIDDIIIKGYRNFLFPLPDENAENIGKLMTGRIMKPFKEPYFRTFFGSGMTNVEIEKLGREQKHALREDRSKAVSVSLRKKS